MQAFERWLYYHWLVILDIWRLRRAFLLHVVIVAGICLPILILGALKRGHVAQLREDLVKSVSGRQIVAWAAQNGRMLEADQVDAFRRELPDVEIVVPESFRPLLMRKKGGQDEGQEATIYATLPGDPVLSELGVASPADGEEAVVLSRRTAESLGVSVGDSVDFILRRRQQGKAETGTITLKVVGVFSASNSSGSMGYVHLSVIEDVERFIRGNAVKRWSLPAFAGISAADRYAGYLVFCRSKDDLQPDDFKTLSDRAMDVTPITSADISLLDRFLKDGYKDRLKIYRVMARQGDGKRPRRMAIPPADVAALTVAEDDIVLPWNEPLTRACEESPVVLVGLSFPERRWLRTEFRDATLAFPTDAGKMPNELSIKFPEGFPSSDAQASVSLAIDGNANAPLTVVDSAKHTDSSTAGLANQQDADNKPSDVGLPFAVVPAPLLAHLDALERQEATYDVETQSFPPVPISPTYDKLRLYSTSIDGVPAVVEALRGQGYGVTSEFTRIKEIHDQDASLALLVQIVMWGVLLFGIITVSIVLIDSTDRKSKTIGIMRIMGVSSSAVSYMVMLRAAIIGVCAAALAAVFGWLFCSFLSWNPGLTDLSNRVPSWLVSLISLKPVALATLDLWQDRGFLLATIACSGLGSLIPAVKASRLDPFDAIMQSRGG